MKKRIVVSFLLVVVLFLVVGGCKCDPESDCGDGCEWDCVNNECKETGLSWKKTCTHQVNFENFATACSALDDFEGTDVNQCEAQTGCMVISKCR